MDLACDHGSDLYIRISEEVSEDTKYIWKTKHPASVMMPGVIGFNGRVMGPGVLPSGYRLAATPYMDVLATKVIP